MAGSFVPKIWGSSDETGFTRTFDLTVDDHLAIQYASRQLLPFWPTVAAMALLLLFAASILNYGLWRDGRIGEFVLIVGAVVIFGSLIAALAVKPFRSLLRHLHRRKLAKVGAIGIPIQSTVGPDGVIYTANGQTVSCPWDSLYAIEEEEGTYYFWLSKLSTHPWPARIFSSNQERQDFADGVRKWSGRQIVSPPLLARLGETGRRNLPDGA